MAYQEPVYNKQAQEYTPTHLMISILLISTSTTFCIDTDNETYNDTSSNYLIQQSCIAQEQDQIETKEAEEAA